MQKASNDHTEWNRIARLYISKEPESARFKLNQINKRIIELTKIYSVDKMEDGKFKLDIDNRDYQKFKILNLPVIEKTTTKSKRKIRQYVSDDTIYFYSRIKDFKYLSNFKF